MKMTVLKYLMQTGVATSAEIIKLKNEHPKDFEDVKDIARQQMLSEGIEIEDSLVNPR